MKQITVKYEGECRKCGTTVTVGSLAIYERRVGIFCLQCAPTDSEEIRVYRQEAADRKADRYDEWAHKREHKAQTQLNSYPSIRHDIAFCTQPGRIPFRDRMNRADERAFESLKVARRMREKAGSLRHVRVAGDAEKARQDRRDSIRLILKPGMKVDTVMYGLGIVEKINKKTAKVKTGQYTQNVDLSWLKILKEEPSCTESE